MQDQILFLHDSKGNLQAVQITPHLWQKLKIHVPDVPTPTAKHDLAAFEEFLSSWSFPYDYQPKVSCPNCESTCTDWQKEPGFILSNANIGGVLVFHCCNCGATVRQKYFKTHVACEFTPPGQ